MRYLRQAGGKAAARSALQEARAWFEQALGVLESARRHCHLGFGNLYRLTGKRQQAAEHLATAGAMDREMDMRFWLGPAEAERAEVRA